MVRWLVMSSERTHTSAGVLQKHRGILCCFHVCTSAGHTQLEGFDEGCLLHRSRLGSFPLIDEEQAEWDAARMHTRHAAYSGSAAWPACGQVPCGAGAGAGAGAAPRPAARRPASVRSR